MDYELAIIGAGAAGYTAGIYAERSGIKTIVFDKADGGGLASVAPKIENYPGFESISGSELMQKMKEHASKYVKLNFNEEVEEINKSNDTFTINTVEDEYKVGAIVLATGTEHRRLNAPGEKKLYGKGVSYCATCDGFFFKDKKVAVIGGGNSALIEAVYLKRIGCKEVYVVHRRDELRAEGAYEQDARDKNVNILFNKTVDKILGDQMVDFLQLKDTKNNEITKLDVDGVFISIGEIPQNKLAKQMDIKLDEKGYIMVNKEQRTNVEGVYAAGDITDGLRQIVTACAEGAIAALSSTEVLGKQYPY